MKYILYARKSTEDEDRQILSIEAQLFELRQFAAKEKLEIVGPTFVETKTAKEPVKNIGSNHILENRQFRFELKNPYDLVAERSEANPVDWTFPAWCSILKIVRTHFAAPPQNDGAKNSAATD